MRTIALCTATINPEKAQAALRKLTEEMFPEIGKERENWMERAMTIMEKEKDKPYSVAPVGHSLRGSSWGRMSEVLKQRRRRRK